MVMSVPTLIYEITASCFRETLTPWSAPLGLKYYKDVFSSAIAGEMRWIANSVEDTRSIVHGQGHESIESEKDFRGTSEL